MPRGGGKSSSLRGYTRVTALKRGKRRTIAWEDSHGKLITDYEYRSRVARKQGWKNASEADRFRKSQTWKRWVLDVSQSRKNYDSKGKYIGPSLSYRSPLMRDAYEVNKRRSEGELLVPEGPNTPLAETELGRLLIGSGRRPDDAFWEYASV